MKSRKNFFLLCIAHCAFFIMHCALCIAHLHPQAHDIERGDTSAAALYVQWAENAIEEGRWEQALVVLERGSDYANMSSDLSFLLAVTRIRLEKPRTDILSALRRALATNRWNKYIPLDARLLEAEQLIAMKSYQEAQNILANANDSPEASRLIMLALRFSQRNMDFLRHTLETINRYPRETGPIKIFLDYLKTEEARGSLPSQSEMQILDMILYRLPVLIEDDPDLAWMAAHFMRDTREAARLVSGYRAAAASGAAAVAPASIPIALNLGVITEYTALTELFSQENMGAGLDIGLLDEVWDLLRSEEARDLFRQYISNFTGIISMDTNNDGIPEACAEYQNGMLISYSYNENQDRLQELIIHFRAGIPHYAMIVQPRIMLLWERYPSVAFAELDNERFIPRPLDFNFAPIQFRNLTSRGIIDQDTANIGVQFPERTMTAAITRRVLVANAYIVERPSAEFEGAIEIIELNQSIPIRAREYLDGRLISETDFLRGRPISQRVDLDLDGRLETFRRFRRFSLTEDNILPSTEILLDYGRDFEYAESDWAGDGILEIQYY